MMKKIFLLLFAVMIIAACSSVKITNHGLKASPDEVAKGGKTTLSWDLESNTDLEVYITNTTDNQIVFDKLPMKGSREITLNSTTTFQLNAKGKKGTAKVEGQSTVTVKVK